MFVISAFVAIPLRLLWKKYHRQAPGDDRVPS